MQAVGDPRSVNVRDPNKYNMPFVRNAWNTPNRWLAQEIKEITNVLWLHTRVDRPTYDQLKSIGMTIGPASKKDIPQRPDVFDLMDTRGYFQTDIVRGMNADKELPDWHHRHNAPVMPNNTRTGAVPVPTGLHGHPMPPAGRRMAATSSPTDENGLKVCWNYNAHMGCATAECVHPHELYKNPKQLSCVTQTVLAKRGGFNQNKRITDDKVPDVIRDISKRSAEEKRSKMKPGGKGRTAPLFAASPATRVSGNPIKVPAEYSQLDYVTQETDLRNVAHWPPRERDEVLPQFAGGRTG